MLLIESQYFPPINVLLAMHCVGEVCLEACENYQKRSYRNRCYLGGSNHIIRLTVPLSQGKNEQLPIRQTRIDNTKDWPVLHWKIIRSCYGRAPYFDYYAEGIQRILSTEYKDLFSLNSHCLQQLLTWLRLPIELTQSTIYEKYPNEHIIDMRGKFKLPPQNLEWRENWPTYPQIFEDRHGFRPNLSTLDLLFCLGPEAGSYLKEWAASKNS